MTTSYDEKDYIQLDVEPFLRNRKAHQATTEYSKGRMQGTGSQNCIFTRSILHASHRNRNDSRPSEMLLSEADTGCQHGQGILRSPRFEPWQDRRQSGSAKLGLESERGKDLTITKKEAGHNLEIPAEQGNAEPFTRRSAHVIPRLIGTIPRHETSPRGLSKRRAELDARCGRSTYSG